MEIISELLTLEGQKKSYHCELVQQPELEPYWHAHPEIELSLVVRGRGIRFVGDHIGHFKEGDLLLSSQHLPHDRVTQTTPEKKTKAEVVVLHLSSNIFLGVPELVDLRSLIDEARKGLLFVDPSISLKEEVKKLIDAQSSSGYLQVLSVFERLLQHSNRKTLSTITYGNEQNSDNQNQRIHKINTYLMEHYADDITQSQIANIVAMSPQSFSRWFKGIMNCTFSEHLNKLRIEKACLLLLNTSLNITNIADQCGYQALSNFNKQFQKLKQIKPREYRKSFAR